MKMRIEFDTDNAAFEVFFAEIEDIMRGLSASIYPEGSGVIKDSNGNTIGQWSHEEV